MKKKSATRGKSTSTVEIVNVSAHGFWLVVDTRELFLAFDDFPWFKEASIGNLLNVKLPHTGHLYWPDLDIDLAVDSIEHPERYPMVSRSRAGKIRESLRRAPTTRRKMKAKRR